MQSVVELNNSLSLTVCVGVSLCKPALTQDKYGDNYVHMQVFNAANDVHWQAYKARVQYMYCVQKQWGLC